MSQISEVNPIVSSLREQFLKNPEATAVVDCADGKIVSVSSLWFKSHSCALRLSQFSVQAGDHVVITIPTSKAYCEIVLGVMLLGAIPVFIDVAIDVKALYECMRELAPKLWITNESYQGFNLIEPRYIVGFDVEEIFHVERENLLAADTCIMLYTTGTTGLPKGVPWSFAAMRSHLSSQIDTYHEFGIRNEFVLFGHLAIAAIAMARVCIIPSLASSQPNFVSMKSAFEQMDRYGCDYVFASPAFWRRFSEYCLEGGLSQSKVRVAATAGASLNVDMLETLAKVLPEAEIFVPYASTEVLMPIANISLAELRVLAKDNIGEGRGIPIGRASPEMEVRIVNFEHDSVSSLTGKDFLTTGTIGEIVVAGPRVTTEYFRRESLTLKSKIRDSGSGKLWHRMGDAGYLDHSGMLWFLSRRKDAWKSKGGWRFADQQEQAYNIQLGTNECAVLPHPQDDLSILIFSDLDRGRITVSNVIKIAADCSFPTPAILFYSGRLPTDSRHNSKINRASLLSWATAPAQKALLRVGEKE